jgi:hypothetical protein
MRTSRSHRQIGVLGVIIAILLISMYAAIKRELFIVAPIGNAERPLVDSATQARRYGAIKIPDRLTDGCRYIEFDNKTGNLREFGIGECAESTSPGPNSTEGRMNAIRGAFSDK